MGVYNECGHEDVALIDIHIHGSISCVPQGSGSFHHDQQLSRLQDRPRMEHQQAVPWICWSNGREVSLPQLCPACSTLSGKWSTPPPMQNLELLS